MTESVMDLRSQLGSESGPGSNLSGASPDGGLDDRNL
jgi:hypothetical protein